MVYQRTQNKGDLLETDIYWKAENYLEFRNRRNEIFTIEPDSVFTVSAEYNHRTDDYEAQISCYGFADVLTDGMKKGTDSPLVVRSKVEQRMSEDEFFALKIDLEKKCVSMKKYMLEHQIMNNSHVRDFCSKDDVLRKECLDVKARVTDLTVQLNSGRRQPTNIEKKLEKFIEVSERVEADPKSCERLKQISQLVFVSNFMLFLLALGSSSSPDIFMVAVFFILMVTGALNFLLGPKVTAVIYCKILSMPFVLADLFIESENGSSTKLDRQACQALEDEIRNVNLELHQRERRQLELKKELDRKFSLINNEAFGAGRLPVMDTAVGQMPEIETRTDEEIIGGCERVAYPVYDKNNDIPASDERKVISLTKSGRRTRNVQEPAVKKVDLRKH